MPDKPTPMSCESLALNLKRDRRSIARALADTAPDDIVQGRSGKYPVYSLSRALEALAKHDARTGYIKPGSVVAGEVTAAIDRIESALERVGDLMSRLRRETDIGKRWNIFEDDGGGRALIEVGRAMAAVNERQPDIIADIVGDVLIEGMLVEVERLLGGGVGNAEAAAAG